MVYNTALRGVFLAGTDTAVGKTTVACALLRLARRSSIPLRPFKPVETGATPIPRDAFRLREAAGAYDLPLESVCPFAFAAPLAPAAAAGRLGPPVSLAALCSAAHHLAAERGPILVESAGGLLTPYAPGLTTADLAAELRLPVLLVARNALGTINHSALTIAELRRRDLPLAGLVLVDTTPEATADRLTNAALIESVAGVRPLGTLPFVPASDADSVADALSRTVDVPALFERLGLRGSTGGEASA